MHGALGLLAKVVHARNGATTLRKLRTVGMGEHLITPLYKPVWAWIKQMDLEGKGLPTETMLRAKFPGVSFPRTEDFKEAVEHDSIEEVVLRLRERNLTLLGLEAGEKLVRLATDNQAMEIPKLLNRVQKDILGSLPIPSVLEAGATIEEDLLEYETFGQPGGAGLRFPYPQVVPGGMGLNPSATYWIYGPPGAKKTWFLTFLTVWYLRHFPRARVLFLGQEMPWKQLRWRLYAMWGGFNWDDLVDHRVEPGKMERVIDEIRIMRRLYVREPIMAPDARPVIEGLISAFEPDYIFDDSPYLRTLQTGRDTSMIRTSATLISEWSGFIKNLTASLGVPYFQTWQPNDDGELYGGRAGQQDAEGIFYLSGPDRGTWSEIGVKKNRDGRPTEAIRIQTDLNDMASFGELSSGSRTLVGSLQKQMDPPVRLSVVKDTA